MKSGPSILCRERDDLWTRKLNLDQRMVNACIVFF